MTLFCHKIAGVLQNNSRIWYQATELVGDRAFDRTCVLLCVGGREEDQRRGDADQDESKHQVNTLKGYFFKHQQAWRNRVTPVPVG